MLMLSLLIFFLMAVSVFFKTSFLFVLFFILGILVMNIFMSGSAMVTSLYFFDEMSLLLSILTLWISFLMVLAMTKTDAKNSSLFFFFLSMMLCMLLNCFFNVNLIGFYLFFESVLVPMLGLIFFWGGQPERLQAGLYMLMYTLFGSLPLLLILLMVNNFLSLSFFYLTFMEGQLVSSFILLMMIFAFLVKMPMYSVHLWLPKAHVEAPVAGSMMLAGVLLKLGGYGLYRVISLIFFSSFYFFDCYLMAINLVGALYIGFICLRQVDIKSLIAYSSVCHMSLVIGGVLSGSLWGSLGVLILMLGHGLCSSALFCVANMMYERFFTRSLMVMKGLIFYFPILTFWWFFFSIINMGAPPFMNLFGEIFLLGSIIKWNFFTLILLGLISFISACYSLYLYSYSQHGKFWFMYGVEMVSLRELFMLYAHFFPLGIYTIKFDLFVNWVF